MRIGGGGSSWASYQSSSVSGMQQRQQGAKSLFAALNAGDLATAQSAFAALQQSNPNLTTSASATAGTSTTSTSPFAAIGSALQAGDLAGAQKAAQNMQAARAGRHHGGGRRNDGDADDAVASSATTSSTATTAQATVSAAPVDAMSALNSFMQNLESALEQQVAGSASATTTSATTPAAGDPATAVASTTASLPYAATAQSVLWSRSNSVLSSATDAQLKTDLDGLIQQMTGASATSASTTNVATTSGSTNTTGAALQDSFASLVGAFGGNSSTASVTSFLQNLEATLGNTASSGNSFSTLA